MKKLLIIDDERPILEMLEISLVSEGYDVFTAESGKAGLETFGKEKPKLVLTDIKMPGMDGIEVLKKIKEKNSEAEVIVITGHGDMDSAIAALRCGASDFLTKPIRDEALMLTLERAKQKISMAQQLKAYAENLEQTVEKRTRELRKAQEDLVKSERLATIGETVAGVAHYIKNILNGLRGGMYKVNSAMAKHKPEQMKDGWDMVQRNIEKVSQLVLDLLSYSKERSPEEKTCSPNQIVAEVVELLKQKADENSIKLNVLFDPNIKEADFDPKGIHDAILNLVSNAIDACISDENTSKSWEVTVKTGTETTDSGIEKILFEVSDNGCGMNPEIRSKVFTRFFSTKEGQGTGLGLLITQKIIQEHGGKITMVSQEGVGTTFLVLLDRKTLKKSKC
ncbi:MAG: response regulator [Deltaproteobacteria bacterium]|nr:response regulator [Deltaproteobacteria bacterium]